MSLKHSTPGLVKFKLCWVPGETLGRKRLGPLFLSKVWGDLAATSVTHVPPEVIEMAWLLLFMSFSVCSFCPRSAVFFPDTLTALPATSPGLLVSESPFPLGHCWLFHMFCSRKYFKLSYTGNCKRQNMGWVSWGDIVSYSYRIGTKGETEAQRKAVAASCIQEWAMRN